jgi:hypothetical protein
VTAGEHDDVDADATTLFDAKALADNLTAHIPDPKRGGKPSAADILIRIGQNRYHFGRATTGEPFAVPNDGPYIARFLRGGRHSLRAELAATYVDIYGRAAPSQAVADAMLALEGRAQAADETQLHLRVAADGADVLLDLGTADATVARISPGHWRLEQPTSGPLFHRTELTRPLPTPIPGGDLGELRHLLNVSDRDWPLLLAWLVAALIPGIPHPILLLTGEQGTGKSTAGRTLATIIDPSGAPLRRAPKDDESWATAAAGGWVVGLDNLSGIPPWLSDAMCRTVTGDGDVRRRLYTDGDLYVMQYRRVLILTSVDAGALRGDLADRLLAIELEPIKSTNRRTDRELAEALPHAHPRILGALLDLTAHALRALPAARERLAERPRMADFAEIVAAVDLVRGTDVLADYVAAGGQLAAVVVEADPVAAAVRDFIARLGTWRGTSAQLHELLTEHAPVHSNAKNWPPDGTRLSGRLRRAAPALRSVGVETTFGKVNGTRWISLNMSGRSPDQQQQTW